MSTSDGSDAPAGLTDTGRVEAFSDGVFAIAAGKSVVAQHRLEAGSLGRASQ